MGLTKSHASAVALLAAFTVGLAGRPLANSDRPALAGDVNAWLPISDSVTARVVSIWPGGTAGVVFDPVSDALYLVAPGQGLWRSRNHGDAFERIDGGMIGGRCETGWALTADPNAAGRLACFMLDGASAWTVNGGKDWTPCNDKSRGFDYVAVDWSERRPRRLFGVRHESGEIGLLSSDGGATWEELGKPFKAFGVFDFSTLVTCRGRGIERSTDGGATWTLVSDKTPGGKLVVVRHGVGYWLAAEGVLVSRDKGATWKLLGSPVKANFGPYFGRKDGTLCVVGPDGFMVSANGGDSWTAAAPLPADKEFHGTWFPNFAWDPAHHLFFASKMGKATLRYREIK